MYKLYGNVVVGLGLSLLVTASPANTLITFEEPTGLLAMPNSFTAVPLSAQLSSQYLASGVLFSSNGSFVAIVDHFPSNPAATPSPPNILGGVSSAGVLDYSAPVQIDFVSTGSAAVSATTSFVSIMGDRFPANTGSITMTAFGLSGKRWAVLLFPTQDR